MPSLTLPSLLSLALTLTTSLAADIQALRADSVAEAVHAAPRHEITPAARSPRQHVRDLAAEQKRQLQVIFDAFTSPVDDDYFLGIQYLPAGTVSIGCVVDQVTTIGDNVGCGVAIGTACVGDSILGPSVALDCVASCITHTIFEEIGDSTSMDMIACGTAGTTLYRTPTELSSQPTSPSDSDEDSDSDDDDDGGLFNDDDDEDEDEDEDDDNGGGATRSSLVAVFGALAGVSAFFLAM